MTTRACVAAVAAGVLLAVTPGSPGTAAPLGPDDTIARPAPANTGTPQLNTRPPVPGPLGITPLPATALSGSELFSAVQRRAAQVESAHETLAEEQAVLADLRAELSIHTEQLAQLDSELGESQQRTDEVARSAYMSALGAPDELGSKTPALISLFSPTADTHPAARAELEHVRESFEADAQSEREYATAVVGHEAEFDTALTELTALQARNDAELAAQRKALDEQRSQTGREVLAGFGGPNSQGMVPGPAAVRAVEFALSQRGKPYVFGAEGPDAYDCSGIVQRAYAEAGVRLPRTARPQWRATTPVATSDLIAGDLVFFGTDRSNWNSIYHVGIYLGRGQLLHAPMPGDHLRVAPMWWDEFFGATRVVPAVAAPAKPKPRQPKPSTPKPSSPAPKPSSDPLPSVPPSPVESPSGEPTPSPAASPDGPSPAVPPGDVLTSPAVAGRVRDDISTQNVGIVR